MKKLNKLLSIIICLAMVLSFVPVAYAAETTETKITSMDQLETGTYKLVCGDAILGVVDGTWITNAESTWTITVNGTNAQLTDANGVAVGPKTGNNNGISTGTAYDWSVTCEDGLFYFWGQGSDTTVLAYNVQNAGFRAYKTSTVSGNPSGYPNGFELYKIEESSGEQEEYEDGMGLAGSGTEEDPWILEELPATLNGIFETANEADLGHYYQYTFTEDGTVDLEAWTSADCSVLILMDGEMVEPPIDVVAGDVIVFCIWHYEGTGNEYEVVLAYEPVMPVYEVVTAPETGVAYKFGMIQENVSATDVYYLAGGMSGYYMSTTTAFTSAIDVYLEETEGGYYLYTMIGDVKTYINMVVSGTYVNGAYEETASTVYTYDTESNTVVATVNDALYWFGTRNDKTYTTVGPCKTSYNGFYCQFYAEHVEEEEPEEPVVPEEPEQEGPIDGNVLIVGNNKLTAAKYTRSEYTFTASQAGTLHLTIRNYSCNGVEYGEQMLDYAWSEILVDGVALTAMQTTLEVTEGQVLTFVMTCDGDAYESNLYLSFEDFYQEPVGSAFNPVKLTPSDCPTTTIEIPAGGEVYYSLDYDFYEHILYVYGENAYIAYEGWLEDGTWGEVYVYAENGVVAYSIWEYEIRIGNAGDTAAVFELDAELPLGLVNNPDTLVIGENETAMTTNLREYYYSWTAETSGTLTVTVEGDSYWAFRVQNLNTGEEYYYFENSGDPNTASVVVNADDQVFVMLRLIELENWDPIDGTLTVTAEFVEGAGEDLSLHLENNYVKVRNGYGDPVTKEYTYVAEQTGTLYVTFRSFGCYGNYWAESDLTDEYKLQGFSLLLNGEPVTVFKNSIEVTEGDSVVVTIASLDGYPYEANIWLSYEGFYEEPVGSDLNPVEVFVDDLPTYTVEIPAGEALYYSFEYAFYDYTLYIYGEDAYIIVNRYNWDTDKSEPTYIYAVDGVVEYDFSDGLDIQIGNAGEAAATFLMEGEIPVGIRNNPDQLIIGEQTATVPADSWVGYWYGWTAPEAGTLTITITGDNWGYELNNQTTYDYAYGYECDGDSNTASLEVAAGDRILLQVVAIDENWEYPGGELTVVAEFTPAGGSEEALLGDVNGDTWVDVEDAMMILQYEVGLLEETELNVTVGDVSGDGYVDVEDAMLILQFEVGLIEKFPAADVPGGTEDDPIEIIFEMNEDYTEGTASVTVPAGKTVYYYAYGVGGMVLTVTDAEGNVVSSQTLEGNPRMPVYFNLTNSGEVDATYTLTVTYPAGTMTNPAELVLGYNEAVVTGNGYFYTWTAEEDTLFALSMASYNWTYCINIEGANGTVYGENRYSDEEAPVYTTVVKVAAGDTITLVIGTADWTEATVAFNAATYAGTAANPVVLNMVWNAMNNAASLNADLPAGEYVYALPIYGSSIMELYINDVKTEYTVVDEMGWDPNTVVINNETEANAIYTLKLQYPAGTQANPETLEMGMISAEMLPMDYQLSHWYSFTAETDTLLVLTMQSDDWYYWGMYIDAASGYPMEMIEGHASTDAVVVPVQVIKVAAGETFWLCVGTQEGTETVEFAAYTYAGTESNPVVLNFIWNGMGSAASLNADLPAGEYVYALPIYGESAMQLFVNGEQTEYTVLDPMGWDPNVVTINNETEMNAVYTLELKGPAGTQANPDTLELGYIESEMIFADYQLSHWYSFTAETDTLLVLTMQGEDWYYWGMYIDTATGYPAEMIDGHASTDEVVVPMQVIKVAAGETFWLCVGTIDGAELVGFTAYTYAGTAEDPILVEFGFNEAGTAATLNIDLPAGEFVLGQRGISSMVLTVNGVETEIVDGGFRYPSTFVVNNEAAGVVSMELVYPLGTAVNPEIVEAGEYTATVVEGTDGYYYNFIATEAGTLTVTVSGEMGWCYNVNNLTAGVYGDRHWFDDEEVVNTVTIEVAAGDVVEILVSTYDPENPWAAPAGTVNMALAFTPAE